MKKKEKDVEELIRSKMAEQGIDMVSMDQQGEDQFQVQGNLLHPVHIGKNTVYVQLPVIASVIKKKNDEIGKVDVQDVKEQAKDAEQFVKTLVDNNQLYGYNDQFPHGATHMLEKNKNGQMVVKRKQFSIT